MFVVIWLLCGAASAMIASQRGRSRFGGFLITTLLAGVFTARPATAQEHPPSWLTVQAGAALPVGIFHDSSDPGPFGGVRLEVPVGDVVSPYVSVNGAHFGLKGGDGSTSLLTAALGASLLAPGRADASRFFVDAGASLTRISRETTTAGTDFRLRFDWSPGFEAGLGAKIPTSERIRIVPTLRYHWFRPKLDGESADEGLSYLTIGIGASFRTW